jgi:hypothetical protein
MFGIEHVKVEAHQANQFSEGGIGAGGEHAVDRQALLEFGFGFICAHGES